mgnify:CR=1 FL=1
MAALLAVIFNARAASLQPSAEKSVFYHTMETGSIDDINAQLDKLKTSILKEKDGYEGALLMKKAGLVHLPAEKLKYFKAGRRKLEAALLQDKDNIELHFLRLTIEEHAPKIVRYHDDIEQDRQIVIKGFKQLPAAAKEAVLNYTKTSKVLHTGDF